jgi:pyocin large subunit-like protein
MLSTLTRPLRSRCFLLAAILFTTISVACSPERAANNTSKPTAEVNPVTPRSNNASAGVDRRIGFSSRQKLLEHFEKHGAEFGNIMIEEYLVQAQSLRDKQLNDDLLEITRSDGVITRFDRKSGAFVAFNSDRTIRTFFKPNEGEAYFRRQARRRG